MLKSGFYNMDCMNGLKEFPNGFFDIAVVDPPYGINVGNEIGRRKGERRNGYKKVEWDKTPPDESYFRELFRVARKVAIWGGNYFALPPTKCFLIWRKPNVQENTSFSMCEYAWTNFEGTAKEFSFLSGRNVQRRFVPTQKPVELYFWILKRYAKPGMKFLDTHVGSASSLIACHRAGLEYWGFEIDPDTYKQANERLEAEKAQIRVADILGGV